MITKDEGVPRGTLFAVCAVAVAGVAVVAWITAVRPSAPQPILAAAPCEDTAGLRGQVADLTQQRAELIHELQEQAAPAPPPPLPPRPAKRRDDIVCRAEADGGGYFVVGAQP